QLKDKKATGVSVAFGFIFSPEFQGKGYTNEEYVEIMYSAFFGRKSDPAGKADWLSKMNNGMSREDLFFGFANSKEFFNLCGSYGITCGCYIKGKDFKQTAKVNLFVERLYNVILGRSCDQGGMQDWSNRLSSGKISGAGAAYGFIFSEEYRNKNKSDSDFLEDLYMAFMGRSSDSNGKTYWQGMINSGKTDRDVFNGFTGSQEFMKICDSYGIVRGGDITTGQTSARAGRGENTNHPSQPTNPDGQGGNPTTPTGTPSTDPTQPTQPTNPTNPTDPTQPVTPVVTSNYDPDNHGGYWVYSAYTMSANNLINNQSNYRKIADRADFNSVNQICRYYVCSSGYVITYNQYSQMDWSQASDPHFGGLMNGDSYYRGSYWAIGFNDDTAYVAIRMCSNWNGVYDAFSTDSHISGAFPVGMRVSSNNGQTWGYRDWNGNSVTGNDYSRWATAMRAWNNGTRHSNALLAKYGITDEKLGDYIMIEWCEGNLTYNLQTLPLPDWSHYTGMGSDNAHSHFSTSVARNTLQTSRTWNYSSRSANVVSTSGGTDSGSNSGDDLGLDFT
ncbi:MAG: DUF4214 domain-containing protein, partial [Clostridiales bacterium]|nr:DUF4214 domain-containing protein [Clostridiales bacterium]